MKLFRFQSVFLFTVLAFTTWACNKSKSGEIDVVVNPPEKETIKTSVQGRVLDEYATPLQGAIVTCGGKDTTTDANGNFLLQDVSVIQDAAVVTVSKPQYISGIRTLIANEKSLHYVQLMLYDRQATSTFSSTSGGTVTLPGGELTIPANDILKENKQPYSGIVDVNFRYINPGNERFPDLMPGDLRGISQTKQQRGLRSYGMMVLELTGQNGEILHLDKEITAKIEIPGSLEGSAPAQIPLWLFNATTGYWEEKTTATKQGDFYTTTVNNTGYWHFALPYDLISFQTKIVDQNNVPVPNIQVTVFTKIDFIPVYSYTDAAGKFNGKVPANEQLIITFTDPCKDLIFRREIGPFAAASVINSIPVTLPINNTLAIDGTANNCANAPVGKGIVSIMVDGLQYATAINKGNFKITILRCNGSAANITFTANDADSSVTTVTTINASNGNITPTLVVCAP